METERKKRIIRPVEERIAENNERIEKLKKLIEKGEEKKGELENLIQGYRKTVTQLEEKNARLVSPAAPRRRPRLTSPMKGLTLEEFAASMGMTVDEMREKASKALAEKKASGINSSSEEETASTKKDS